MKVPILGLSQRWVLSSLQVAIKIINKRKMEQMNMHEKIRREITILEGLKHPHVPTRAI